MKHYVIEGRHQDPNNYQSIWQNTLKHYGPMDFDTAHRLAKDLVMKNIDDFHHRAWVLDHKEWNQFYAHRNKVQSRVDKK